MLNRKKHFSANPTQLTRLEFVNICQDAIEDAKEKISIENQVNGYLRFHKEFKENNFFSNLRAIVRKNERKHGYSLFSKYQLIKQVKVARCHEMAEYLSVRIIKKLKAVDARVRIVSSRKTDHVYLQIKIWLKGERATSTWEVDAWDPRIIDVSMRPDGTIKNSESLTYGCHPEVLYSTSINEFFKSKKNIYTIPVTKPVPGIPVKDATPERDIPIKHKHIYSNYLLADAYRDGKLSEQDELGYLQQKSSWQ